MNLKNRINAINNKLTVCPQEEAKQQELKRRIEEARQRCGIKGSDQLVCDVNPGASLADKLTAAIRAHIAKEITR
jgi:hypothetical protein